MNQRIKTLISEFTRLCINNFVCPAKKLKIECRHGWNNDCSYLVDADSTQCSKLIEAVYEKEK